jgi:hypothetical protein
MSKRNASEGMYRDVYWYRHHWGLELAHYPGDGDYRVMRKVVWDSDYPVTVKSSVDEFLNDIASGLVK